VPILGFLATLIHKSLFLRGEEGFRSVHWLSKLAFTAAVVYCYVSGGTHSSPLTLLAVVSILGGLSTGFTWLYASLALSAIPAAWHAATTLAMIAAGYSWLPVTAPATVFLRTLALSEAVIFIASTVSPSTLCNTLCRIGLRKYAVSPLLAWRVVPLSLNYAVEVLAVAKLKGVKRGSALAPAIASTLELGKYVRESSYVKVYGVPQHKLPVKTSWKHTILLCTATAVLAVLASTLQF